MGSVIITSIVAFTIIILLLVFLLLFAQSKLVASGDVKILINGEKEIVTAAGSTLLNTLSNNKVFLPSACGGGGTCAMCKCVIEEGGGEVLPTEEGHLSRAEKQEKVRLTCQVKVKQDMKIRIPDEIFGIKKWQCEVVSNYLLEGALTIQCRT
jgi:Na+-transporting NADH:ubiquinone oxidoreductase subunit F